MPALFAGPSLADHLVGITRNLLDRAGRLPPVAWGATVDPMPSDVITTALAASEHIAIPAFTWTALRMQTAETEVPSIEEHDGRPIIRRARGLQVLADIPYTGDHRLLTHRPTEYTIGGFDPRVTAHATGLGIGHVRVTITGRHLHDDVVMRDLEHIALLIEAHLGYARADLTRWVHDLVPRLEHAVAERAAFHVELAAIDQLLTGP